MSKHLWMRTEVRLVANIGNPFRMPGISVMSVKPDSVTLAIQTLETTAKDKKHGVPKSYLMSVDLTKTQWRRIRSKINRELKTY